MCLPGPPLPGNEKLESVIFFVSSSFLPLTKTCRAQAMPRWARDCYHFRLTSRDWVWQAGVYAVPVRPALTCDGLMARRFGQGRHPVLVMSLASFSDWH